MFEKIAEFFFSAFVGIILGLLFFVSAKHYAHKRYEVAWLWMIFTLGVSLALCFLQFPEMNSFMGTAALTTLTLTIRKIMFHKKNVNRHSYAQRYGEWMWIFLVMFAMIWIIREFLR